MIKQVIPEIVARKGICILTADHGNAEQMIDKTGAIMTSHTCNPVDLSIIDGDYKGDYVVDTTGIKTPGLPSLAATYINLLGFEAPPMYEPSLIKVVKK